MASLTLGCSRNTAATNYVVNPDVETCCEWPPDVNFASWTDQLSKASVQISFAGNITKMWQRAGSFS
eukprot:1429225-Karenia_brevis.AAC.1